MCDYVWYNVSYAYYDEKLRVDETRNDEQGRSVTKKQNKKHINKNWATGSTKKLNWNLKN